MAESDWVGDFAGCGSGDAPDGVCFARCGVGKALILAASKSDSKDSD